MQSFGKLIIIIGIILIIAGLIIYFSGNKLHWFGNLPGDIKVEKQNVKFYFPITTMILLSIILSIILWIIRKLF